MSFSNDTTYSISYDGNGTTTAFAWSNVLLDKDHVAVYLYDEADGTSALQTRVTHYTVDLANDKSSATVNMVTAPASTEKLRIQYNVPLTQERNYINFTGHSAESMEEALDNAALQSLTIQADLDRGLRFDRGQIADGTLPNPYGKDGYAIVLNDDGDDTWSINYSAVADSTTGITALATPVTDNAIVRWNGTDGLTIQNSVGIIDDSGDLSGITNITAAASLGFDINSVTDRLTIGDTSLTFGSSGTHLSSTSNFYGALDVTGNSTVTGTFDVTGDATVTGDVTVTGETTYTEQSRYDQVTSLSSSSGTLTWNLNTTDPVASLTLTENITTLTFDTAVACTNATLIITQDSGSAYTIADAVWTAANVEFAGGTAPDLSTLNSVTVVYLFCYNGTNYVGSYAENIS